VVGNGENYIDAMYVDDAVAALNAVLTQPSSGVRTFDLGLGRRETVNQIVAHAAQVYGLTAEIAHVGSSPEYITFFIDPTAFGEAYGFQPRVEFADGMLRLAAHLRQEAALVRG
jgi:nucleoside-diphosphate-sugar epimerase